MVDSPAMFPRSSGSGGVGIVVDLMADRVGDPVRAVIVRVHPATPGQRAGLTPGTALLAVDGRPITGHAHNEIVALIRGEPGSKVCLSVEDPNGGTCTLTIERVTRATWGCRCPDAPSAGASDAPPTGRLS